MRILLCSALVALALAGCASPTAMPESGVTGTVWIGPMCPVVREGEPCPDQPYPTTLVVTDADGRERARQETDPTAAFHIPLPPGDYVLSPLTDNPGGLAFASPLPITVVAGQWTVVEVHVDSGIR